VGNLSCSNPSGGAISRRTARPLFCCCSITSPSSARLLFALLMLSASYPSTTGHASHSHSLLDIFATRPRRCAPISAGHYREGPSLRKTRNVIYRVSGDRRYTGTQPPCRSGHWALSDLGDTHRLPSLSAIQIPDTTAAPSVSDTTRFGTWVLGFGDAAPETHRKRPVSPANPCLPSCSFISRPLLHPLNASCPVSGPDRIIADWRLITGLFPVASW
jgi:hypothetical protein